VTRRLGRAAGACLFLAVCLFILGDVPLPRRIPTGAPISIRPHTHERPDSKADARSQIPVGDLRAVWAHASSTKTKEDARALLDRVEAANANAIFWLGFWWGGKAFFQNSLLDMPDLGDESEDEDFDPLDYLCKEGRRRGIEIHVRFVNGDHGSSDPSPIFDAHPDWRQVLPSGERKLWYDFNKPQVRQFHSDLMLEAAEGYPIAGLQFDFVRFGNAEGCMCEWCTATFEAEAGLPITGWDEARVPTVVSVRANPLQRVTTAQVLAEFDSGLPALTHNTYGDGETILLNWHADEGPGRLPATILNRALDGWGCEPGPLPCIHTKASAAYHRKYARNVEGLLAGLGYSAEWTTPEELSPQPEVPVALVPNCYLASESDARIIARYIAAGTRMIFIDGPIWAVEHEPLADALGVTDKGEAITGLVAILPTTETHLLDPIERDVSVDDVRRLPDQWWEFQAGHIAELISDVSRRVRSLPRPVVVSACAFPRRSVARGLVQDWPRWAREDLVDYVVPMAYTLDDDELAESIAEWRAVDPDLSHFAPGLMIYESDANPVPRPAREVLRQMEICREAGMSGVALFAEPQVSQDLTDALVDGPWSKPAPR